jgi:hypothetical protein
MINHARCLLLNVAGGSYDPADRDMLNFRARQLLAVAHATPLAEYLKAFDSRVTYDFESPELFNDAAWTPEVTGTGSGTLAVVGTYDPPDVAGRVGYQFQITVTTPGQATVARLTPPFLKPVLGFSAGDRLPLAGTGLDALMSSAAAGQSFSVRGRLRPVRGVVELVDGISSLGEPTYIDLFGLSGEEPARTFRRVWFEHREVAMRLAAMICAVVYRTERARKDGR